MVPSFSQFYCLSPMKEKPRATSSSLPRGSTKTTIVTPRSLPRLHLSVTRASQEASVQNLQSTTEAGVRENQVPPLALDTAPSNSFRPLGFQDPKGPGAFLPGSIPAALKQIPLPPFGLHLLLHAVDRDKISLPEV